MRTPDRQSQEHIQTAWPSRGFPDRTPNAMLDESTVACRRTLPSGPHSRVTPTRCHMVHHATRGTRGPPGVSHPRPCVSTPRHLGERGPQRCSLATGTAVRALPLAALRHHPDDCRRPSDCQPRTMRWTAHFQWVEHAARGAPIATRNLRSPTAASSQTDN